MNQYDVMITKLRHYDTTYDYDMSMYDNLPYKRDRERCNEAVVGAVSGNVYHMGSYNFIYNPTPYVYTAPDMDYSQIDNEYSYDNQYAEDNSDVIYEDTPEHPDEGSASDQEMVDLLLAEADFTDNNELSA